MGGLGTALGSAVEAEDLGARAAANALGVKGMQEARRVAVEAAASRWQKAQVDGDMAKDENVTALLDLEKWQGGFEAECEAKHEQLMAARDKLRNSFQGRLDKQVALRELVQNEDMDDIEHLQSVLTAARETGVQVWDPQLVESGDVKVSCLREFGALRSAFGADADPAIERAANEAFEAKVTKAKELLKQATAKKVPLSPDLKAEVLLAEAEELVAAFKSLRHAVTDTDHLDPETLLNALQRVRDQGKELWDEASVARGDMKAKALQAFGVLRSAVHPLDAGAKEEVAKAHELAKEVFPQLQEIGLPDDFGAGELLEKATELLK